MTTARLICDKDTFRGRESDAVRWLDRDADFEMAQRFSPAEIGLTKQMWEEARNAGYRYCAVVQDNEIVALAAEYRFSDEAWMLASVRTADAYRRRGLGKEVCSFVTAHILTSGRLATCETIENNLPMIRIAESIGFRVSELSHPGETAEPPT